MVSEAELLRDLEEGRGVWLVECDPMPLILPVDAEFASAAGAAARSGSQWRYGTISVAQYLPAAQQTSR
jgi:hypothetical protein